MSKNHRPSAERSPKLQAALGFLAHSGWAVLVVIAGPARSPVVIARRRIELIGPGTPNQPYHAAAKLELGAAKKLVRTCEHTALRLAKQAIAALRNDLQAQGYELAGCGLVLASGRPLPAFEAILSSHPLIHTAEGELFRESLAQAAQKFDLPVTRVRARELYATGAAQLGIRIEKLQERVKELGRGAGRPWGADEKQATLVAWLALAASTDSAAGK
jgi:hypothetical protein